MMELLIGWLVLNYVLAAGIVVRETEARATGGRKILFFFLALAVLPAHALAKQAILDD